MSNFIGVQKSNRNKPLVITITACQNLHSHKSPASSVKCLTTPKSKPSVFIKEKCTVNRTIKSDGNEIIEETVTKTVSDNPFEGNVSDSSLKIEKCCSCSTQTGSENKMVNVPSGITLNIPVVKPRYHGPCCALEICVLEKHQPQCKFKKTNPCKKLSPDDKCGSYEVIGRMKFKTCEGTETIQPQCPPKCPISGSSQTICPKKSTSSESLTQKACCCKRKRRWYECLCPCVQTLKTFDVCIP